METYSETQGDENESDTLNLITHVEVEKACQSDSQALIPAIESTQARSLGPKQLVADSLYGSDDNCEKAKTKGVDLIAPTMGNAEKGSVKLSDFEFSNDGHVIRCPKGYSPVFKKKKKTRFTQGFCLKTCSQCPLKESCPAKQGKRYYYLRYEQKAMRIAKRKAAEQTDSFKDKYRWRAGVEATMSEYDRRTGVKRLRFRGLKAVRFCAVLKAIGVNLFRATAARARQWPKDRCPQGALKGLGQLFFVVKEQILAIFSRKTNLSEKLPGIINSTLLKAA